MLFSDEDKNTGRFVKQDKNMVHHFKYRSFILQLLAIYVNYNVYVCFAEVYIHTCNLFEAFIEI